MATNQYVPSDVSPPGATLAETIEAIGMSQAELARRTNRPIKTINEIIHGKEAITPETAIQLERVLGVPAGFWQARESRYREFLAREKESARLGEHLKQLRAVPVKSMQKLGWLPRTSDRVEQLRTVLNFFGCGNVEALNQRAALAQFRASSAFRANPAAVGAWLRRGHVLAQQIQCEPFDEKKFTQALLAARELSYDMPTDFAHKLQQLCASAGVAVVYVPELPKTCLWGATRWISPVKAVVQLSLRYKRDDHFWFTFHHEAAHVLRHGKTEVFIESNEQSTAPDQKEREADEFASHFLLPSREIEQRFKGRYISEQQVLTAANELRVSAGVIVGRLQHEGKLPRTHLNKLKKVIEFSKVA